MIVTGDEYSLIAVFRESDGLHLKQISGGDVRADEKLSESTLFLRVAVEAPDAACTFEYSEDGTTYEKIGSVFHATRAKWIGAKVGVFASSRRGESASGYADFDWVRVFDYGRYPNVSVRQ